MDDVDEFAELAEIVRMLAAEDEWNLNDDGVCPFSFCGAVRDQGQAHRALCPKHRADEWLHRHEAEHD